MEHAVEALRAHGEAFAMTLTTLSGQPIEAQGRAIGGRAVLRLKDASTVTRDLMQLTERHQKLADRGRIAAHADRNAAVAGVDARCGGAADLRQLRLCARRRSTRCGRRHRTEPGIVRQRRARSDRAGTRRAGILCGPAASGGCRRPAKLRRAGFPHRHRQRRHRHSTRQKRKPCGARSRAWSTRTAAPSTNCRSASPCSMPISG